MCSIIPATANVGSSYNRMRGPGIGCWFSDRSNCKSKSKSKSKSKKILFIVGTL